MSKKDLEIEKQGWHWPQKVCVFNSPYSIGEYTTFYCNFQGQKSLFYACAVQLYTQVCYHNLAVQFYSH